MESSELESCLMRENLEWAEWFDWLERPCDGRATPDAKREVSLSSTQTSAQSTSTSTNSYPTDNQPEWEQLFPKSSVADRLSLHKMFSINSGLHVPTNEDIHAFWQHNLVAQSIIKYFCDLPPIAHNGPDRFLDLGNKILFDIPIKNIKSKPREFGVQESKDILLAGFFPINFENINYRLGPKGLDYINDFENNRRDSLRKAASALELTEQNWRTRYSPIAGGIKEWLLCVHREEQKIFNLLSKIYINLRNWTMAKMLQEPQFNKLDLLAMLNTLYPPNSATEINQFANREAINAHRNAFFYLILDMEAEPHPGRRLEIANNHIKRMSQIALHRWSSVRDALDIYLELSGREIHDAKIVVAKGGIEAFSRPSDGSTSMMLYEWYRQNPVQYPYLTLDRIGSYFDDEVEQQRGYTENALIETPLVPTPTSSPTLVSESPTRSLSSRFESSQSLGATDYTVFISNSPLVPMPSTIATFQNPRAEGGKNLGLESPAVSPLLPLVQNSPATPRPRSKSKLPSFKAQKSFHPLNLSPTRSPRTQLSESILSPRKTANQANSNNIRIPRKPTTGENSYYLPVDEAVYDQIQRRQQGRPMAANQPDRMLWIPRSSSSEAPKSQPTSQGGGEYLESISNSQGEPDAIPPPIPPRNPRRNCPSRGSGHPNSRTHSTRPARVLRSNNVPARPGKLPPPPSNPNRFSAITEVSEPSSTSSPRRQRPLVSITQSKLSHTTLNEEETLGPISSDIEPQPFTDILNHNRRRERDSIGSFESVNAESVFNSFITLGEPASEPTKLVVPNPAATKPTTNKPVAITIRTLSDSPNEAVHGEHLITSSKLLNETKVSKFRKNSMRGLRTAFNNSSSPAIASPLEDLQPLLPPPRIFENLNQSTPELGRNFQRPSTDLESNYSNPQSSRSRFGNILWRPRATSLGINAESPSVAPQHHTDKHENALRTRVPPKHARLHKKPSLSSNLRNGFGLLRKTKQEATLPQAQTPEVMAEEVPPVPPINSKMRDRPLRDKNSRGTRFGIAISAKDIRNGASNGAVRPSKLPYRLKTPVQSTDSLFLEKDAKELTESIISEQLREQGQTQETSSGKGNASGRPAYHRESNQRNASQPTSFSVSTPNFSPQSQRPSTSISAQAEHVRKFNINPDSTSLQIPSGGTMRRMLANASTYGSGLRLKFAPQKNRRKKGRKLDLQQEVNKDEWEDTILTSAADNIFVETTLQDSTFADIAVTETTLAETTLIDTPASENVRGVDSVTDNSNTRHVSFTLDPPLTLNHQQTDTSPQATPSTEKVPSIFTPVTDQVPLTTESSTENIPSILGSNTRKVASTPRSFKREVSSILKPSTRKLSSASTSIIDQVLSISRSSTDRAPPTPRFSTEQASSISGSSTEKAPSNRTVVPFARTSTLRNLESAKSSLAAESDASEFSKFNGFLVQDYRGSNCSVSGSAKFLSACEKVTRLIPELTEHLPTRPAESAPSRETILSDLEAKAYCQEPEMERPPLSSVRRKPTRGVQLSSFPAVGTEFAERSEILPTDRWWESDDMNPPIYDPSGGIEGDFADEDEPATLYEGYEEEQPVEISKELIAYTLRRIEEDKKKVAERNARPPTYPNKAYLDPDRPEYKQMEYIRQWTMAAAVAKQNGLAPPPGKPDIYRGLIEGEMPYRRKEDPEEEERNPKDEYSHLHPALRPTPYDPKGSPDNDYYWTVRPTVGPAPYLAQNLSLPSSSNYSPRLGKRAGVSEEAVRTPRDSQLPSNKSATPSRSTTLVLSGKQSQRQSQVSERSSAGTPTASAVSLSLRRSSLAQSFKSFKEATDPSDLLDENGIAIFREENVVGVPVPLPSTFQEVDDEESDDDPPPVPKVPVALLAKRQSMHLQHGHNAIHSKTMVEKAKDSVSTAVRVASGNARAGDRVLGNTLNRFMQNHSGNHLAASTNNVPRHTRDPSRELTPSLSPDESKSDGKELSKGVKHESVKTAMSEKSTKSIKPSKNERQQSLVSYQSSVAGPITRPELPEASSGLRGLTNQNILPSSSTRQTSRFMSIDRKSLPPNAMMFDDWKMSHESSGQSQRRASNHSNGQVISASSSRVATPVSTSSGFEDVLNTIRIPRGAAINSPSAATRFDAPSLPQPRRSFGPSSNTRGRVDHPSSSRSFGSSSTTRGRVDIPPPSRSFVPSSIIGDRSSNPAAPRSSMISSLSQDRSTNRSSTRSSIPIPIKIVGRRRRERER